jgi:hypothetical protein
MTYDDDDKSKDNTGKSKVVLSTTPCRRMGEWSIAPWSLNLDSYEWLVSLHGRLNPEGNAL